MAAWNTTTKSLAPSGAALTTTFPLAWITPRACKACGSTDKASDPALVQQRMLYPLTVGYLKTPLQQLSK
jgi:hypothetical protein